jgi:hypothetical protein
MRNRQDAALANQAVSAAALHGNLDIGSPKRGKQ